MRNTKIRQIQCFFYTFQDHFSVLKINWIFFSLFVEEPFFISFLIILTFKFFTFKKYAPGFSALLIKIIRDVKKLISFFQNFSNFYVFSLNVQLEIQIVLNGLYFLSTMSMCIKWVTIGSIFLNSINRLCLLQQSVTEQQQSKMASCQEPIGA